MASGARPAPRTGVRPSRRGAWCCSGRSCCAHFKVHAYINRGLRAGTLSAREQLYHTRTRWYDQGNHIVQKSWRRNFLIHNATVERWSEPNQTGFTWFVGKNEVGPDNWRKVFGGAP